MVSRSCGRVPVGHVLGEIMITVNPLGGAGAEILGVDIANISDDDLAVVRQAFADYGVIFFRDQELTETEHIAFAKNFSTINVNRFFVQHPEYPEIALVVKEADHQFNIGGGWHADHSYDFDPALGSMLVARELPPTGGDTLFASMNAAYEGLPDDLRELVDTHSALHSGKHIFAKDGAYDRIDDFHGRIGNADAGDELVDTVHPMVIKHPLSGKPMLFVNPGFTIGIEGIEDDEAKLLLLRLYEHAGQEQFTCRFVWEPGSIAFWDNRAVWHFAQNDYAGHRRVMHRITLDGCPLEAANPTIASSAAAV